MKFELKTENENYFKLRSSILSTVFILALLIIFCDVAYRLRIIARHFQIDYSCKLLAAEKSTSNFKTLSRLSNLKSKQRIWDFCREVIN